MSQTPSTIKSIKLIVLKPPNATGESRVRTPLSVLNRNDESSFQSSGKQTFNNYGAARSSSVALQTNKYASKLVFTQSEAEPAKPSASLTLKSPAVQFVSGRPLQYSEKSFRPPVTTFPQANKSLFPPSKQESIIGITTNHAKQSSTSNFSGPIVGAVSSKKQAIHDGGQNSVASPALQTNNIILDEIYPQLETVVEEEIAESSIGVHENDGLIVIKGLISNPQQDKELLEARQRADKALDLMGNIDDDDDEEEDLISVPSDSDIDSEDDIFSDDNQDMTENCKSIESGSDSDLSDDFVVKKKCKSLTLNKKKRSSSYNAESSAGSKTESYVNDTDKIMKILPSNYSYQVLSSNVTVAKFIHVSAKIRVNVTSGEEAEKWLHAFEMSSKTNHRVMKTWKRETCDRVLFKKQYRCHHNTLAEKSGSKIPHEKHIKCPAQLVITVNNPSMKWSKDHFLKSHPCVITVKHMHNHETDNAFGDVLRHRRPCPQVVQDFTAMFTNEKERITPTQAMRIHLSNVEKNDPDLHSMGDGALCPEMSWVYKLFNKIMKRRCGEPYGPEMIAALEKNVEDYNIECKDICAKIGSTPDGKHHFVAVCSPLMKRVLTHHKTSGEVMFIDSSGNMDNCNARVFVMLTASVVCGLPEGLLITFSESEQIITLALQLWKTLLPKKAFYGRGLRGPKVIMSDDSTAERSSLKFNFPEAILLLCIFHVLQAMWRYIWDSAHLVKFEDKPYIFHLFRQLLYAKTIEEFNSLYEEILEDVRLKSYDLVWQHIKDLWKRANEWALCFRVDLLLRKNDTNNFAEVLMRIIKDYILGRLRAYNTVQLFNLLLGEIGLDTFYRRKLALVVNNRIRNSRSRLRVDPKKLKDLKATRLSYSEQLFQVENMKKNTKYVVDADLEFCSCPVGSDGTPCKHQLKVVKEFKISHHQFLPNNDPDFKMTLYYIMTGKTTAPDGFFRTLKGDTESAVVTPVSVDEDSENQVPSDPNEYDLLTSDGINEIQESSEVSEAEVKEKVYEFADDLVKQVVSNPNIMEPLGKFLKAYWAVATRNDSESTLSSALATFGKEQSVLTPVSVTKRQFINVQPTALARRRTEGTKGRQALPGGKPRKAVAQAAEHAYNAEEKKKKRKPVTQEPTWACPPKKQSKVPHSLSQCVEVNARLPK